MERCFYVQVTYTSKYYEVLSRSTTLEDYQSAVDSLKHYVDYLIKFHPHDKSTMVGSFVHPYDSTVTFYAKTFINGTECFLGLQKFTYYE